MSNLQLIYFFVCYITVDKTIKDGRINLTTGNIQLYMLLRVRVRVKFGRIRVLTPNAT